MARKKQYDDDDGRTVADMSGVERPSLFRIRPFASEEDKPISDENEEIQQSRPWENSQFSKEERRSFVLGAMSASAVIAGVFIAAAAVVISIIYFFGK